MRLIYTISLIVFLLACKSANVTTGNSGSMSDKAARDLYKACLEEPGSVQYLHNSDSTFAVIFLSDRSNQANTFLDFIVYHIPQRKVILESHSEYQRIKWVSDHELLFTKIRGAEGAHLTNRMYSSPARTDYLFNVLTTELSEATNTQKPSEK